MVIMAGMLPGVEFARRRRLRQGGSSSSSGAAGEAARRPPLCLYAGAGHDLGSSSSASSKERMSSLVCKEMARAWTLDSNAREAKERLDQKLRGQRESVAKRQQSTGSGVRAPAMIGNQSAMSSGADGNHSGSSPCAVRREVVVPKARSAAGGSSWSWSWRRLLLLRFRSRRRAEQWEEECAVCLEEVRAGEVVARLPCAHRFHWSCAVPWVQAASRCPVCRAHVRLQVDEAS